MGCNGKQLLIQGKRARRNNKISIWKRVFSLYSINQQVVVRKKNDIQDSFQVESKDRQKLSKRIGALQTKSKCRSVVQMSFFKHFIVHFYDWGREKEGEKGKKRRKEKRKF